MENSIGVEFGRRVAVMRRSHKMTLEQLAACSGVSRSMLSQIERGGANPTLAVAARIAEAFGLSIVHLIEEGVRPSLVEIVQSDNAQAVFIDKDGCKLRTLTPLHMEKDIEFYELTLSSGGKVVSAPHCSGTREILTVASGAIALTVGNDPTSILHAGDTAHYPADRQHKIENAQEGPTISYLIVTYS